MFFFSVRLWNHPVELVLGPFLMGVPATEGDGWHGKFIEMSSHSWDEQYVYYYIYHFRI